MVKVHLLDKNQTLLLFLGIVSSYSTASCFGTTHSHWPGRGALHQYFLWSQSPNHLLPPSQKLTLALRGGDEFTNPEEGSQIDTESEELTNEQQEKDKEFSTIASPDDPSPVTFNTQQVTETVLGEVPADKKMGPKASPPGLLRRRFPSFPWHTLPNVLTYARCVAIPGLMVQFYTSQHASKNIHSALIFSVASLTDYLDGYLARRWDICSPFGAFLDPVADKLMVSTALVLLSGKYGTIVAIPSAIILAREIAVSALREWMASRGQRDSVKVGFQGKCKTALTMMALTIVLAVPDGWSVSSLSSFWKRSLGGWEFVMTFGMMMLYLSALVTVTSGSVYFRAAAPVLMGKKNP